MKTPFIVGDEIYLRGLERNDLSGNMFNWANDSDITRYMYTGLKPNNLDLLEQEYDQLMNSDKDVVMAIVDKKTDMHVGNVGLYAINWLYRSAEYRIIIGEKEFWGKPKKKK